MTRTSALFLAFTLAGTAMAARLTVKDLPPAVQKTVAGSLHGAAVKSIARETEKGVAQYEIETMLNGRHRDFNVDSNGILLVVEEETTLDAVPAAARAAILKKVGSGKLRSVETVAKPGNDTLYEAAFTTPAGKKSAVLVTAAGAETRD